MVDGDISEADWLKFYRHLLGELERRGFNEVRAEIETAAAAPVVDWRTALQQTKPGF